MQVGMLWFDGDQKRALGERIERAAAYYRSKYGKAANVCFAHPTTLGKKPPTEVAGLKLCANGMILPHHFWLGVDEPAPVPGG